MHVHSLYLADSCGDGEVTSFHSPRDNYRFLALTQYIATYVMLYSVHNSPKLWLVEAQVRPCTWLSCCWPRPRCLL